MQLLTSQQFHQPFTNDPAAAVEEIRKMGFPTVEEIAMPTFYAVQASGNGLPTVVVHGMGDICFNRGITNAIAAKTGSYLRDMHPYWWQRPFQYHQRLLQDHGQLR